MHLLTCWTASMPYLVVHRASALAAISHTTTGGAAAAQTRRFANHDTPQLPRPDSHLDLPAFRLPPPSRGDRRGIGEGSQSTRTMTQRPPDPAELLRGYSACDVADALVRLRVPGAGFVADLAARAHGSGSGEIVIGRAATVLFTRTGDAPPASPDRNIPAGAHWADLVPAGAVAVVAQSAGQANAVCGGQVARRLRVRGVRAALVYGRIRDVDEMQRIGLPIWSRGVSAVGSAPSSRAWAVQVPVRLGETTVTPGDIVVADAANGVVVVVPQERLAEVVALLPGMVAAEALVRADVVAGDAVAAAFARHRVRF